MEQRLKVAHEELKAALEAAGPRPAPRPLAEPKTRTRPSVDTAVGTDLLRGLNEELLRVPDGWIVFVGDVAGRGPAAATLTALARYTLRTAGMLSGDPLVALATLNRALRERDRLSLCSACVVFLHDEDARADVVLAGHPPALVLRGDDVEPVGVSGPLLGAFDDVGWQPEVTRLAAGQQIVMVAPSAWTWHGLEQGVLAIHERAVLAETR